MTGATHRGIFTRCPGCLYGCDSASGVTTSAEPADGDVSVCLNCGAVSLFDRSADTGLRSPTPAELVDLMADDDVRQAAGYIRTRGMFRTGRP